MSFNFGSFGGYLYHRIKNPDRWEVKLHVPIWDDTLPTSFYFHGKEASSLHTFLQKMLTGDDVIVMQATQTMLITDVTYPEPINQEMIDVSLKQVIDFLRLRNKWRIPLNSRVRFIYAKGPNGYVARLGEFITVLGTVDPDLAGIQKGDATTKAAGTGLEGEVIDSGYYLPKGSPGLPVWNDEEDDGQPPAETQISRKAHDNHAELLTMVTPRSGRPYFIRRLMTYSGEIAFSGTSWAAEGPWTAYTRNSSLLLALGINP